MINLMEVSVKMSADELLEFIQYQKDKSHFELQYLRDVAEIRGRCDGICTGILNAISESPKSSNAVPLFEIKNARLLAAVVDSATEWFA